ncbi:hypothetical protein [Nocardia donostiensis]|uniref:hypothetical protein n=1 Tax=Nocardia donostiensis TaxID=1538463 RepID=UPI0020CB39A3|nr:hypothetical protein [Nocardia donostiensis]
MQPLLLQSLRVAAFDGIEMKWVLDVEQFLVQGEDEAAALEVIGYHVDREHRNIHSGLEPSQQDDGGPKLECSPELGVVACSATFSVGVSEHRIADFGIGVRAAGLRYDGESCREVTRIPDPSILVDKAVYIVADRERGELIPRQRALLGHLACEVIEDHLSQLEFRPGFRKWSVSSSHLK